MVLGSLYSLKHVDVCSMHYKALCTFGGDSSWEPGLILPVGPRDPTHVIRRDRDLSSLGPIPNRHCALLDLLQAYHNHI